MENLIPVDEFCTKYNLEVSFISSLQENGMIEITNIEDTAYFKSSQLHELERIVRLYFELDINLEGIETIDHLLQQINSMHDEIISLKNRLRFYEPDE